MDWIAWFLFESLAALGAALFVVNFVLLVIWRRSGRPRPLVISLAVALLLLLLQTAVTTRREAVTRLLGGIEQDVRNAQISRIGAALAPGFSAGPMQAEDFLEYVQRQYAHVRVHSVKRTALELQPVAGERFDTTVGYLADVDAEAYRGPVRTTWNFEFVRTDDGWRVQSIRPRSIENWTVSGWGALPTP